MLQHRDKHIALCAVLSLHPELLGLFLSLQAGDLHSYQLKKQDILRKFQLNCSPEPKLPLLMAVGAGTPRQCWQGQHFGRIPGDIITALVPTASASPVLMVGGGSFKCSLSLFSF